jgi:hypothetical protein
MGTNPNPMDARLIACAPEMLEALKRIAELRATPVNMSRQGDAVDSLRDLVYGIREIANAAIARAEGKLGT